ncbi:MAG: hypothetical protein JNM56_35605 [Planctomycetia bacterium]|nr:hypothetical protein [Planctomycetia bacterium]
MPTVTEIWAGRGGGDTAGGSGNEGTQRRYTRRFRVLMDSALDDSYEVLRVEGIPRITDPYVSSKGATDLGARCHDRNAEQVEGHRRMWEVTAEYSTDPADIGDPDKEGGGDGGEQDPLAQPAEIVWDGNEATRPAEVGYDANFGTVRGVVNSAGDPFDPPYEIDDYRPTLTITRNQANYSQGLALAYVNKVNNDGFFGFAPGQAKCKKISAKSVTEKGRTFWSVTYVFELRETWEVQYLDQGIYEWVGNDRRHIKTDDPERLPVSAPVPLNGAGGKLPRADVLDGNFAYRTYLFYTSASFSGLNLP